MDELDGVVRAEGCASVDDLLSTSLDLSVATLDTGKVEINAALAGLDGGSCTTTKPNKHGRAAKDDQVGASTDQTLLLEGMLGTNGSDTARKHDRLVVSTQLGLGL